MFLRLKSWNRHCEYWLAASLRILCTLYFTMCWQYCRYLNVLGVMAAQITIVSPISTDIFRCTFLGVDRYQIQMLHYVRIPILLLLIFIFNLRLFVLVELNFLGGIRWPTLLGLLVVRFFSNWIQLSLHWLQLYHLLLIISLLWGQWLLLGTGWGSPCRFLLTLDIILITGL